MNTLESCTIDSPYGKTEECAKFVIDVLEDPFTLANITVVDQKYTFSLWLKADAAGIITVSGKAFTASTDWVRYEHTFTADRKDVVIAFNVAGTYYIYYPQLEVGDKATDWLPAPEDLEESVQTDLSQIKQEVEAVEKNFADLTVQSDGIMAEVSKTQQNVEGVREQITAIEQTATGLSLRIKEIQDDGVSKVTTEKGYTFGNDGLHISGAEGMENVLDEKGMVVSRSGEVVLQANETGVIAADVKVRNYLIVGSHARFEDYTDGTDSKRTACFCIDGG